MNYSSPSKLAALLDIRSLLAPLVMVDTQLRAPSAVVGPASAVDNRVAFFDGVTGKLIKDSGLGLSGSNTGDQTRTSLGLNTTGLAVMVGGTVVVADATVTANSRIFLTPQNASGTPGSVSVSARTVGVSFTILSTDALDTRVVAWWIVGP